MAQQTDAPTDREVQCTECGNHTTVDAEAARLGGYIECPFCGDDIDLDAALADDDPDDDDDGETVETEQWALERLFEHATFDVAHGNATDELEAACDHVQDALTGDEPAPVDDDEILLAVDLDHQEAREYFDLWGEQIDGIPVIREVRARRGDDTHPRCETCQEKKRGCYRLTNDMAGVPVCRDCLGEYDWVTAVVDSRDALAAATAEGTA